jgi:hypothetical protein
MASNRELEQFILEFGLKFRQTVTGVLPSLPALLNSAQNKLGNIDPRQLQDAIYTMNPLRASFAKFLPHGLSAALQKHRNHPDWRNFFNGDFNVQVLPEGRSILTN